MIQTIVSTYQGANVFVYNPFNNAEFNTPNQQEDDLNNWNGQVWSPYTYSNMGEWNSYGGNLSLDANLNVAGNINTSGSLSAGYISSGSSITSQGDMNAAGNVNASGNVTANGLFIGNGSQLTYLPLPSVFNASGSTHTSGLVPDPGATAGSTRYLREDASWDAVSVPVPTVSKERPYGIGDANQTIYLSAPLNTSALRTTINIPTGMQIKILAAGIAIQSGAFNTGSLVLSVGWTTNSEVFASVGVGGLTGPGTYWEHPSGYSAFRGGTGNTTINFNFNNLITYGTAVGTCYVIGVLIPITGTAQDITAAANVTAAGNVTGATLIATPGAAPATPANGQMWVNSTANTFNIRINGITRSVNLT
jgi:hypothetical protein